MALAVVVAGSGAVAGVGVVARAGAGVAVTRAVVAMWLVAGNWGCCG